jgi:hypothetical protein
MHPGERARALYLNVMQLPAGSSIFVNGATTMKVEIRRSRGRIWSLVEDGRRRALRGRGSDTVHPQHLAGPGVQGGKGSPPTLEAVSFTPGGYRQVAPDPGPRGPVPPVVEPVGDLGPSEDVTLLVGLIRRL